MPKEYNGSRYADRLPIGKEDILKNFKYDTLRRFYRRLVSARPDGGDCRLATSTPAEAQRLVERHFSGLVTRRASAPASIR